MPTLKPELREGETVLEEEGAYTYASDGQVSSIGIPNRLWLTNQRLILKESLLAPQLALPLYAIADLREQEVAGRLMVRIEFTNGLVRWLSTFQNQSQFLDALRAAQAQAPQIPETVVVPKAVSQSMVIKIALAFLIPAFACLLLATCLVVGFFTLAGLSH